MAQDELEKTLEKVIDKKITPQFVKIGERLEKVEKKLEDHDKQFHRINQKLDATMEMTAKNSEDITMMKIDLAEMQEEVSDTNFTTQRIESTLNTVVQDQNSQDMKTKQINRRVLKLESKR